MGSDFVMPSCPRVPLPACPLGCGSAAFQSTDQLEQFSPLAKHGRCANLFEDWDFSVGKAGDVQASPPFLFSTQPTRWSRTISNAGLSAWGLMM